MNDVIRVEKPKAIHRIRQKLGGNNHVIAASAGTGKTYTLERLVLDKILTGTPIDEILVVTFTRRAAAEMTRRIRKTLTKILATDEDDDAEYYWEIGDEERARIERALNAFDEATFSTIHSFCQEIISDHAFSCSQLFNASRADAAEIFEECFFDVLRDTIAAEDDYQLWLKAALKEGIKLDKLASQIQTLISRGATVLPEMEEGKPFGGQSPEDLEKWQIRTACWQLFRPLVEKRVRETMIDEGLMTYDDLLRVVRQGVENGRLATVLRDRYKVVLVDEFQDTDPVQWAIFEQVFLANDDRELYVIGDEKQAIYSFRGADLATYRQAINSDGFGDESVPLERNFRSTDALIEAYNELFEVGFFGGEYSDVKGPPNGKKVTRTFSDECGNDPIEVVHLDSNGEKRRRKPVESVYRVWMANKIDALLGQKEEFCWIDDGEKRHLEAGDIYVLTRTNREGEEIGELLADRGIPYAFYRKPGLFDGDEARDVIRLLRAIARPSDRSLRRKAMLTPFFAIRLDELLDYDDVEEGAWSARKQLQSWQDTAKRRDFSQLFDQIMKDSGVIRRELLTSDSERRLTNYRHLFDWLLGKASEGHLGIEQLADLLQRYRDGSVTDDEEEETDLQRLETDRSAVQIMTMHKSKGLSAEVVFVAGGFGKRDDENSKRPLKIFSYDRETGDRRPLALHINGEFPGYVNDAFSQFVRSEEERLFYVAITRAKSKVYLPYFNKKFEKYKWLPKSSIRFVFEALEQLNGAGLPSLDQVDGFEKTTIRLDEVDTTPRPPTLIESADDVLPDDSAKLNTLKSAYRPTGPGEATFDDLKNNRKRITTSYSGMKSESSDLGEAVKLDHDEPLPKSINAGNALHGILEFLDYSTALDASSVEEWLTSQTGDQTMGELIAEHLDDQGFDPEVFTDYTAKVVYEALRAPLRVDDGTLPSAAELDGVDTETSETAREVSFLLPIPQREGASLGQAPPPELRIEKGYFTGEIDLVFEHDGRIYIADWKSDTRIGGPTYDYETLKKHVEANYRKQVAVYTTAMMRMLGIETEEQYQERFGGFFYLFVRGMNQEGDRGQFFERLPWSETVRLRQRFVSNSTPSEAIKTWNKQRQGE